MQVRPVTLIEFVEGVPIDTPPRNTSYPVTPTLSVDAVHDNVKLVAVRLDEASPVGTVGASVSGDPSSTKWKKSKSAFCGVPDAAPLKAMIPIFTFERVCVCVVQTWVHEFPSAE